MYHYTVVFRAAANALLRDSIFVRTDCMTLLEEAKIERLIETAPIGRLIAPYGWEVIVSFTTPWYEHRTLNRLIEAGAVSLFSYRPVDPFVLD